MERVATLRGIDGDPRIGHGPAIGRLLRALTAAATLSVAGTLEAQEPSARPGPSQSVQRYAQERNQTLSSIRTLLERVDADEFAERNAATKELEDAAYRLKRSEPRVGQDVRELLTGKLSAEQKSRVGPIVERVTTFHFMPSKLALTGTVRCDEILRLWGRHMNITLSPGDETIAERMRNTIEVRPDMTYAETIAALCVATDTVPVAEVRSVRFMQRTPEMGISSTAWAVGLHRSHEDGSTTVQALAEPGFAKIVRMSLSDGSDGFLAYEWRDGDTVKPNPKHKSRWMVAGMLLEPRALRFESNGRATAGFQEVETKTRRLPEGWRTTVTVTSNLPREPKEGEPKRPAMAGDPPTPKNLSMQTVCSSNRFVIVGDYGTPLQPTHTEGTPFVDGMQFTFDTAQRPARVDADVWTVYEEQSIEMPLTPPTPPPPSPSDPVAK